MNVNIIKVLPTYGDTSNRMVDIVFSFDDCPIIKVTYASNVFKRIFIVLTNKSGSCCSDSRELRIGSLPDRTAESSPFADAIHNALKQTVTTLTIDFRWCEDAVKLLNEFVSIVNNEKSDMKKELAYREDRIRKCYAEREAEIERINNLYIMEQPN